MLPPRYLLPSGFLTPVKQKNGFHGAGTIYRIYRILTSIFFYPVNPVNPVRILRSVICVICVICGSKKSRPKGQPFYLIKQEP